MRQEKFRCHPSIIFEKIWGVIIFLFFIVTSNFKKYDIQNMIESGVNIKNLLIVGGIIGLLIIILVYNIFVWSKTFINIEENTIVIEKDTMNSNTNTFGIKNISNINLEQNIFERIMGTYKIKIDTDSLSTANETDIEIVLSKEKAYEFKSKVVTLMNKEKVENQTFEGHMKDLDTTINNIFDDEIEHDIVYSTKDLLKHCFYNLSIGGLIINLSAFAGIIFSAIEIDGIKDVFTLVILIITYGWSVVSFFIGDIFKFYKFSIKREEDKLYISYGLFNVKKFTIPVNRINAINIKQNFLSRILKKYKCDIDTIGVGDDEDEGAQILLCNNKEDFINNMKILLPEFPIVEKLDLEKEYKNHHIIRIAHIIIGISIFTLFLYAIYKFDFNVPPVVFLCIDVIILLMSIVFSYMAYRNRGVCIGQSYMAISFGIISKQISIIKYKKIQYIEVNETFISSKLGLCRGKIHILAGLGNDTKSLGYYDENLFEKVKSKILT